MSIPLRPRFKQQLRPSIVPPGVLFLMSEHAEHVLEGPGFVALAPLLDGTRTIGEILQAAGSQAPWPHLMAALAQLEKRGCLAEGAVTGSVAEAAFWDTLGTDPERVAAILREHPLAIRALPPLDLVPLREALLAAGFPVRDDDPGPSAESPLLVVATPDYLRPELAGINRVSLEAGRPWVLFQPAGSVSLIGPLFRPGETGCWECLAHRLRHNRQVEHYACRRTGLAAPLQQPHGLFEPAARLAAALAAERLSRAVVIGGSESIDGKLLSFDSLRREFSEHALVRRPQCPACGERREASEGSCRIVLEPQPRAAGGAGERSADAAQTFARYQHLVSPLTGVVCSLSSRERNEDGGVHNYVAGHYFPMTSDSMSALRTNLVARSGGKGRSASQAKTAALCEALERYSGIAWGDEPARVASPAELGESAVPVRELLLFSERQYATRGAFNAGNVSEYHDVPAPLDQRAKIAWTPVWSLSHERVRYLPKAYCYYGYRDPGLFFTRCDSNGNAAGNTREEAILYGLLELVERDAVALWWYNRCRRPALDADGFGLAYWAEMRRYYASELDRELHALDLTSDLGIPVVAVVSRRRARAVEDVILGFAAHLDPRTALLRALAEANQYLSSVREEDASGRTVYRLFNEETVRWWRTATFANQPYLVPDPLLPRRRLADLPSRQTDDVRDDVLLCVEEMKRAGLEVLVLDQTRPDIGLPVVKVVVPGLRHFWRRLAPGRLYEVPVRLGWIPKPLDEDELNPVSCFV